MDDTLKRSRESITVVSKGSTLSIGLNQHVFGAETGTSFKYVFSIPLAPQEWASTLYVHIHESQT